MDAVEAGVMVTEASQNCCVGLGANPDRDGFVTLDASIMDENFNCGSVAFLERIKHPISVARRVMEKTPHVMLVGIGAQEFAVEEGFPLEPQELSDEAQKAYDNWLKKSEYKPPAINIENDGNKKIMDHLRRHVMMMAHGIMIPSECWRWMPMEISAAVVLPVAPDLK